ncbi:kelch-like protein 8 [Ornithodoros turicata]|uniref:kelch-like protein 8 n=1 Tax=Ornithodoros turicata TaxID=34597 RepID=UPI003139033C
MEEEVNSRFRAVDMAGRTFERLQQFWQQNELCDVHVRVGERAWRCHRLVLASCSPYFHAMFTAPLIESQQHEVTIGDIEEHAMDQVIRFAYTGSVDLSVENVQALLHAASVLQLDTLAAATSDFVRSHLLPTNALAVAQFSELHGLYDLSADADKFVRRNFLQVASTQEFLAVDAEHLSRLLDAPDLNVVSEAQVYEAVMRWLKADQVTRLAHLASVLERVRLTQLPPALLRRLTQAEESVRNSLRCRDLLDEARDQQLWKAALLSGPAPAKGPRTRPRYSYAGVLFCVGGRDPSGDPSSSIEVYNILEDRWFKVADMITRRRHVGAVSAGGKVYAVGGSDDKHHLASAEVYDPTGNLWKPLASMSIPRRGLGLCQLGGPLYAVGGMDDVTFFNTVERYDISSDTWAVVAPTRSPRGGVAVAALKGCIYAVGGNVGQITLNTCEKYDPHLNKWTYVASMSQRRAGAGAAVLDGYIFVVGGFDSNQPLNSAERYDPELDHWVAIRPMNMCRGGVGVATLAGCLYAVGGHNGSQYLDSVEVYSPDTDRWESCASIATGRAGPGVTHCTSTAVELILPG